MNKKMKSHHKKFKEISNKDLYTKLEKDKKKEEAERITYLERISNSLRLPSDLLAGAPIITVIGKNEICVENYKGILEYSNTYIKILTKIGRVQIEGKKLCIEYFTKEEMKITGIIHKLDYSNGGEV